MSFGGLSTLKSIIGGSSLENEKSESQEKISRLGLSLIVILAGSFLAPLQMHSSTLAIPAIAREMGLTADMISWFTLSQVLASACFVLPRASYQTVSAAAVCLPSAY
jgi:hypothetical protein